MLAMIEKIVREIENDDNLKTRDLCCRALANRMGLDDFGEVMLEMPSPVYPRISLLLPAMADIMIQNLWTGENGYALLRKTANFVRSFSYNVTRFSTIDIQRSFILDYGCGYGRIARLMLYFTASDRLYGVDPWYRSIEECKLAGMGENFRLSDYLPDKLPVKSTTFDLAYAFSVFTHLSRHAALAAFSAVRKHMKTGGIFMITIRPIEYWPLAETMYGYSTKAHYDNHENEGFAFHPQPGNAGSSGEPTYGDTSMSLDWIISNVPHWRIEAIDRSIEDAFQVYVFLRAV